LHVKTRTQLAAVLQEHEPRIVYYYGPANGDGVTLQLHLEDGLLDVTDLPRLWRKPPQVLFLNLLEDDPISPDLMYNALIILKFLSSGNC
jgi:hypothetical protein